MSRQFLRRIEASTYLREQYGIRAAAATLAKWAHLGGGPVMHYDGRFPLYAVDDLDAWAQTRLSRGVRSTSDLREVA
jgi:hypothetical protein